MFQDFFPIGLGSAGLSGNFPGYSFGHIEETMATNIIDACFHSNIKIIDCAPVYGLGEAEKRVGKALKTLGLREKIFLTSKSGVSWTPQGRIYKSNEPKLAIQMLEDSLKRLQTDYIDLYFIHWPDPHYDIRYCFESLLKEKNKGKIRFLGLCNTTQEDYLKALELGEVSCVQAEWNLWCPSETFVQKYPVPTFSSLSEKQEKNPSFMSWGILDKGILTQTVTATRHFEEYDCRKKAPWWKARPLSLLYRLVEEEIRPLAATLFPESDHPLLNCAVFYNLLTTPHSSVHLCGLKTLEQLKDLLNVVNFFQLLKEKERLTIQEDLSLLSSFLFSKIQEEANKHKAHNHRPS